MSLPHVRTAAMVAAAGYAAGAVLELLRDQPAVFSEPLDYVIEATFVLGLAATVVALCGLITRQRSVVARTALAVAGLGNATLLVAATGTLVLGREVLDGAFVLGVLGVAIGYLGLAVVDLARRCSPRRVGVALLLGFIGSIVVSSVLGAVLESGGDGGTAGGFALAAAWVAVRQLLLPTNSSTVVTAEAGRSDRR